jgi:hypothetical protein
VELVGGRVASRWSEEPSPSSLLDRVLPTSDDRRRNRLVGELGVDEIGKAGHGASLPAKKKMR